MMHYKINKFHLKLLINKIENQKNGLQNKEKIQKRKRMKLLKDNKVHMKLL